MSREAERALITRKNGVCILQHNFLTVLNEFWITFFNCRFQNYAFIFNGNWSGLHSLLFTFVFRVTILSISLADFDNFDYDIM